MHALTQILMTLKPGEQITFRTKEQYGWKTLEVRLTYKQYSDSPTLACEWAFDLVNPNQEEIIVEEIASLLNRLREEKEKRYD